MITGDGGKSAADYANDADRIRVIRIICGALEGQTSVEREAPVGHSVQGLAHASGWIGGRKFPEAYVVDVRSAGDERPAWIVHHVDRIEPDFKLFTF